MRFPVFAFLIALGGLGAAHAAATHADAEARWHRHAENVRIVRDNWGIAHIYGKTDADTVFGAIYAQAEDDFGRIERNYLNGLGVLAKAEGESAIYSDLRQRLFIDPLLLHERYRGSPVWLKRLMEAWSDGLNYFLW
jgi:acyl-homoserine-lactone acylase